MLEIGEFFLRVFEGIGFFRYLFSKTYRQRIRNRWKSASGITVAVDILGWAIGASLLIVIAISIAIIELGYFIGSDMCANTVESSQLSPDGKWKIVLFERDCGATTGFSSQISLLKANENLSNESGNVYTAEGEPRSYTVKWQGNNLVKVTGPTSRGNLKLAELNGVRFSYE